MLIQLGPWGDARKERGQTLGQSIWLSTILGRSDGAPPEVDLEVERATGEYVRSLINDGKVLAVHDISDGGLAVAVAEMALASGRGARIHNYDWQSPVTSFLFGEKQSRYILEVTSDVDEEIGAHCSNDPRELLQCEHIGYVEGESLIFEFEDEPHLDCEILLADLRAAHESFFKDWMES